MRPHSNGTPPCLNAGLHLSCCLPAQLPASTQPADVTATPMHDKRWQAVPGSRPLQGWVASTRWHPAPLRSVRRAAARCGDAEERWWCSHSASRAGVRGSGHPGAAGGFASHSTLHSALCTACACDSQGGRRTNWCDQLWDKECSCKPRFTAAKAHGSPLLSSRPAKPPPAGNFANTLTILLLLAVQGATGAVVTPTEAEVAWRVQVRWVRRLAHRHAFWEQPRACRL